jgi:predicted enzyme related to lactoylglutathione lyase
MTKMLDYDGGLTCAMEVSDLERSMAWYQSVLGFEILYQVDDIGWCELQTPVQRVTVGLSQVESPQVRGGATLTFGVEDVDRARSALEKTAVRFDGETRTIEGLVKLATFFDPDGNRLMFAQSLEGGA